MKTLKALIIDDEEDARENLRSLLERFCPHVKISGVASSAGEAEKLIQECKPDMLFLDIQMPGDSGFDLLEKFPKPQFSVIFTTAYDRYALKAIKCSALDYLLKPVDITELKEAVLKAGLREHKGLQTFLNNKTQLESIVLPYRGNHVVKKLESILYCEANSNYTIFHFNDNEKIVVSKTLKEYELMFEGLFIRVHSKYLVNPTWVKHMHTSKDLLELSNGITIQVSRRKKTDILKFLSVNRSGN